MVQSEGYFNVIKIKQENIQNLKLR